MSVPVEVRGMSEQNESTQFWSCISLIIRDMDYTLHTRTPVCLVLTVYTF